MLFSAGELDSLLFAPPGQFEAPGANSAVDKHVFHVDDFRADDEE
jgi:hypothetical protein